MKQYKGKILSIAGSDSSGGAGIQADIKTITMLGCYAASCITSITAQNTAGIYSVWDVAPEVIEKQIVAVLSDIAIDAIKIGMLPINLVETVAQVIPAEIPVILDPVMVSTSGFNLVNPSHFVKNIAPILSKTFLITPNMHEATVISGSTSPCNSKQEAMEIGKNIKQVLGVNNILLKGICVENRVEDILFTEGEVLCFEHAKFPTSAHGTGCTLSAAIACFIAQGMSIKNSVGLAINYLMDAMLDIPKIGKGFNPVPHNYSLL